MRPKGDFGRMDQAEAVLNDAPIAPPDTKPTGKICKANARAYAKLYGHLSHEARRANRDAKARAEAEAIQPQVEAQAKQAEQDGFVLERLSRIEEQIRGLDD